MVPRNEYLRLKRLDKRFKDFFAYLEYLSTIEKARKEKHTKKGVEQEKLAALHIGITFIDAGLPTTERFHFRPRQHNARFHRIFDKIVEPRFAVVGGDFEKGLAQLKPIVESPPKQ